MRPLGAHLDAEEKKLVAAAPPMRMVVAKLRGVDPPRAKWSAGGGSRAPRHQSIGLGQQERLIAESREESRSMRSRLPWGASALVRRKAGATLVADRYTDPNYTSESDVYLPKAAAIHSIHYPRVGSQWGILYIKKLMYS